MVKQLSISFKKGTNTSIKHNNREFTEKDWQAKHHEHINEEKTAENIIIKQEWIRDKYTEIFGEAVEQYNKKQKRSDRKITDYFTKVKKDKTLNTQYEFIVQVGDIDDFKNNDDLKLANTILKNYAESFEERNPKFKVYNAVIHNDEATPHLHINVIPVADGYKQGMTLRPALNKAMMQQLSIVKKGDSRDILKQFREKETDYLENQLKENKINRKIVGTNTIKDQHQYKELKSELKKMTERKKEIEEIIKHAEGKPVEFKPLKQKKGIFGGEITSKTEVIIKKEDFEKLQTDSKALPIARKKLEVVQKEKHKLLEVVGFWKEKFETMESKMEKLVKKKDFAEKIVKFASEFVKEKLNIKLSDEWKNKNSQDKTKELENRTETKNENKQVKWNNPKL